MRNTQPIYLDYAATAPLRPEVKKALYQAEELFGNPASIHRMGQEALNLVDGARTKIAGVLNCKASEIVFTGSGTEADNLALKGTLLKSKKGHIVTSAIEHKAILETCKYLESLGYAVTYVQPNREGVVETKAVLAAIREDTKLVSIMYVNNEVGTIQPVEEIGEKLKALNRERTQKVLFHIDAVQAGTLLDLNVAALRVDFLSLSGHKLGGPKGVGVLYVRDGVQLVPQIHGGGQEKGVRSATLNVAGIVGMATALEICAKTRDKETKRLKQLQNYLLGELKKTKGVSINGSVKQRSASNVNFSIKDKPSDESVIYFDLHNIAVSAASACSSGSIESSYVLKAMGLPESRTTSSVRVTMGYGTRKSDLEALVRDLKKLV